MPNEQKTVDKMDPSQTAKEPTVEITVKYLDALRQAVSFRSTTVPIYIAKAPSCITASAPIPATSWAGDITSTAFAATGSA